ncbi:MAG: HlyD family efflux transporter periplasmic adaptor subunit [Deltaproteobacteria bacterium]|nr:HlyD family efflux transporter periplasmic adaptor subunit [Deltaproteobacteria bacterium]
MKRVVIIVGVLCVVLAVALTVRLRQLNAYQSAPAGGTGTIEGTEVNITARIGARITAVHVREGDQVKSGQLLVELDCSEPEALLAEGRARVASAEASVHAAHAAAASAAGSTVAARRAIAAVQAEQAAVQAERQNVDKETERLAALHRTGAITTSQLEQIETRKVGAAERVVAVKANQDVAVARVTVAQRSQVAAMAQTDAARALVEAARAAVKRAEVAVRECRLTAPRDGVVLTRSYEPGEVVLPGANLLVIVDLREVKATFYLPNAELAAAAPGKKVTVRADAYPGAAFAGTIKHVAAKAEFTPKNVQTREDRDRLVYGVEVTIPNPAGKLRPGMPVEVEIDGTRK